MAKRKYTRTITIPPAPKDSAYAKRKVVEAELERVAKAHKTAKFIAEVTPLIAKLIEMDGKLSVWDILPDFGSYVADMENNIKMDTDTLYSYETDPSPFYRDLLGDFGVGTWTDEQIAQAVNNYVNP